MASNTVINLNKVRAASETENAERAVFVFDYFAPGSNVDQYTQRPLVKVQHGSLRRNAAGEWIFNGVNLYRVGERGGDPGVRTYRLGNINGLVRRP